jgi:hypothetical protein
MSSFPLLNAFLTMLWFFLRILWFFLVCSIIFDIFRSRDLGGWAKAGWTIFVIVLPFLGVFVYLIARGGKMYERQAREVQAREEQVRAYVKEAAGRRHRRGAGKARRTEATRSHQRGRVRAGKGQGTHLTCIRVELRALPVPSDNSMRETCRSVFTGLSHQRRTVRARNACGRFRSTRRGQIIQSGRFERSGLLEQRRETDTDGWSAGMAGRTSGHDDAVSRVPRPGERTMSAVTAHRHVLSPARCRHDRSKGCDGVRWWRRC